MANNAPSSRPCCPMICVVPAAMPQVGMAAETMLMFMVAPMPAPVVFPQMPQIDGFYGAGQMNFNTTMPYLGNAPFSCTPEGYWTSYTSQTPFGEEAPQQLPMECTASIKLATKVQADADSCHWIEHANPESSQIEVPAQIQMDSMMLLPQSKNKAASGSANTLRHRRGQEYSAQVSNRNGADTFNRDDQYADEDMTAESNEAQARKIASQLIEQLQAGGNAQRAAVASLERMAFTGKTTSRAAQLVLKEASMADAAIFAAGLRGHIRNAVQSKHANHVVQTITEVMSVAGASFVVDELKGFGREVARHVFGCRVLCRILEHLSPNDASTMELVEEVFVDLDELCSNSFGSFVVRHLLEFGLPTHKHRIVTALCKDLIGHAKHKFGSHVVEAALTHASHEDKQVLARALLGDREQLMVLASNQFGRHVVRALLALPSDLKKEAVRVLRPMEYQLKSSRYGKSVLQTLRAAASV